MKLSSNSWLVRYAYFTSDYIPESTNLCRLFWRCVLLQPLKLLWFGVVLGVVLFGLFGVWYLSFGLKGLLAGPLFWIAFIGAIVAYKAFSGWLEDSPAPTMIMTASDWIQTVKGNYCPKIEID